MSLMSDIRYGPGRSSVYRKLYQLRKWKRESEGRRDVVTRERGCFSSLSIWPRDWILPVPSFHADQREREGT